MWNNFNLFCLFPLWLVRKWILCLENARAAVLKAALQVLEIHSRVSDDCNVCWIRFLRNLGAKHISDTWTPYFTNFFIFGIRKQASLIGWSSLAKCLPELCCFSLWVLINQPKSVRLFLPLANYSLYLFPYLSWRHLFSLRWSRDWQAIVLVHHNNKFYFASVYEYSVRKKDLAALN